MLFQQRSQYLSFKILLEIHPNFPATLAFPQDNGKVHFAQKQKIASRRKDLVRIPWIPDDAYLWTNNFSSVYSFIMNLCIQ